MKNNISLIFVMLFLFLGIQTLQAQSDYKIVQDFRENVQKIQQSIKSVDSSGAINQINESIDKLETDFASHRNLLDKSLYPESFDGTIDLLKNTTKAREQVFVQVAELHTIVTKLNTQIDTLNQRNADLEAKLVMLENENKENVERLEKLIAQLRTDLQRRDQIVMNMIDNILPSSFQEGGEMSKIEKQNLLSKTEKEKLLPHIKKAINDNIRFLEATKLYAGDLSKIKAQQEKFVQVWKNVGPQLSKVYAEKGRNVKNVTDIDQDFALWDAKINNEAWESIKSDFAENNINLQPFSNGVEFTASITSYIDDAIKNKDEAGKTKSESLYKDFNTVWDDKITASWLPFLADNKMITRDQKITMEAKISSWEDVIYPESFNWMYIVAGVLLLAIIVLFFELLSSRKKVKNYNVQGQHL